MYSAVTRLTRGELLGVACRFVIIALSSYSQLSTLLFHCFYHIPLPLSLIHHVTNATGSHRRLPDLHDLSSVCSFGWNSLHASGCRGLPSSPRLRCWRGKANACLDLAANYDPALSVHEGYLLQSRLEVGDCYVCTCEIFLTRSCEL